jgi:hypothetical protein
MPLAVASKPSTMTTRNEGDDAKPYVVLNEIGKGSFATVYKGYHEVRGIKTAFVSVPTLDYRRADNKSQSRLLNLTT